MSARIIEFLLYYPPSVEDPVISNPVIEKLFSHIPDERSDSQSSSTLKNDALYENSGDDADDFRVNTGYKELIPQFNSNIQRALALVRLNKVKFNAEYKFWMVMDENDQPFVDKLFPNAICSCKYV